MMSSTPAKEVLDICFSRCVRDKASDSIDTSQILELIRQLERLLSVPNLFTKEEISLIHEMTSKSVSKLHKSQLDQFLSKLAGVSTFLELLKTRAGMSTFSLQRLLDNQRTFRLTQSFPRSRHPVDHRSRFPSDNFSSLSSATSKYPIRSIFRTRSPTSQNKDVPHIPRNFTKTPDYSTSLPKSSSSNETLHQQEIQHLETKISNLQKYTDILESQVDRKANSPKDRTAIKDLVSKNLEQEKVIRNLENLCNRYQQDLRELATQEKTNMKVIEQFKESLNKQSQFIASLKQKLQLEDGETDTNLLHGFLKNAPLVRERYLFHKYQREQKNPVTLFISIVSLVFTTIISLNLLKLVFFIFASYSSGWFSSNGFGYIHDYDTYNTPSYIPVVWWQQFESLEYLIYRISDWLDF